jgi:hypothetical protein
LIIWPQNRELSIFVSGWLERRILDLIEDHAEGFMAERERERE